MPAPIFIPDPVDYVDFDRNSLAERLTRLSMSVFTDLDLEEAAELATLFLEANSHVGDVIGFYIRKLGRESRWSTAVQRKNLVAMVKLIGYRVPGATAARTPVTITLPSVTAADVLFPAGTIAKTIEVTAPAKFQLLSDLTILTGQTTGTVMAEHSEPAEDVFTSTGQPNQRFRLAKRPFLDLSAVPVAADGTYTEVANFLNSMGTDRHFVTIVDQNDRCTIAFGNGLNGAIPVGDITVDYKTGGGTKGNIAPGALVKLEGTFADANGNGVRPTVTNGDVTKGTDRATVEQIREQGPASLRVQGRAVAREDFEIVAEGHAGIARALALTSNEDPAVGENEYNIFLVPEDMGTPTQDLKDAVKAHFVEMPGQAAPDNPCDPTTLINIFGGVYLVVNVQAKVFLRKGAIPAVVRAAVVSNLTAFFSVRKANGALNPLINFGYYIQDIDGEPTGTLSWSDVFDIVRDTTGVLKVGADVDGLLLNGVRTDPIIELRQFPKLGTVTLIDGGTGLPF